MTQQDEVRERIVKREETYLINPEKARMEWDKRRKNMAEIQKSLRFRVNISRGMKGAVSFEATVDGEGYEMDEVLAKSAELVAKLEQKYPIKLEA